MSLEPGSTGEPGVSGRCRRKAPVEPGSEIGAVGWVCRGVSTAAPCCRVRSRWAVTLWWGHRPSGVRLRRRTGVRIHRRTPRRCQRAAPSQLGRRTPGRARRQRPARSGHRQLAGCARRAVPARGWNRSSSPSQTRFHRSRANVSAGPLDRGSCTGLSSRARVRPLGSAPDGDCTPKSGPLLRRLLSSSVQRPWIQVRHRRGVARRGLRRTRGAR